MYRAPQVHALNPAGGTMLAVEPLGDIMAWLAETGPKGWALAGRRLLLGVVSDTKVMSQDM